MSDLVPDIAPIPPAVPPAPGILFFDVPWNRKTPGGKKILKGIFATDDREVIDNLRRSPEVKMLAADDPKVLQAAIGATLQRASGGNLLQALDRKAPDWREWAARRGTVAVDAFTKAQGAKAQAEAAAAAVMPVVPTGLKLPSVGDALAAVLPVGSDANEVMEEARTGKAKPAPVTERVATSAGKTAETTTATTLTESVAQVDDNGDEVEDEDPAKRDPFKFMTVPKLKAHLKGAGVAFSTHARQEELAALARTHDETRKARG